jgi:predicted RNase H-like nuclease (RuvC/YqgF family)
MTPKLFKVMRQKKKREVDPNAPPRPNLMTHNVKLRDQENVLNTMTREVHYLKDTVRRLENKLNNQTSYLDALHRRLLKNK